LRDANKLVVAATQDLCRAKSNFPSRRWLPFDPGGWMLSATGTMEDSMNKASLDNRHRNKDGEISGKHGNTLIRTLRKVYGQGFAAGYPETEKLSEVLLTLNETSLSQLRRDHETGHLGHKIAGAAE
jgi:hypothetical protein